MKSEKVSVIVPVYNPKKRWLKECLESIENQTYENIEIVIVDDSPEANHKELAGEILKSDFRFINNEQNLGIPKTRNKGVRNSEGEFFTILDQDDVILEEKIEKQVEKFEANEICGMVLTNLAHIDKEGNIIKKRDFDKRLRDMDGKETAKYLLELMEGSLEKYPPLTSEMIRREVFEDVGKYNVNLHGMNDREIMMKISSNGYHVELIDEILMKKRYHGDNASNSIEIVNDREKLLEIILSSYPEFENYRSPILRRIHWQRVGNYFFGRDIINFSRSYITCLMAHPAYTIRKTLKYAKKSYLN